MSTEMDETRVRPPMRRSVKILLFASLALNLLVAGLVAGAVLSHRDGAHARFDRAGGPMVAALSPSDRRAIGRELRRTARGTLPTRGEMRAAYAEVVAALGADPFDPVPLRQVLERELQVLNQRVGLGTEVLLQRVEAMSAEERAAYAARLDEVLRRGPIRKDRRAPGGRRGAWSAVGHWHGRN